jgi:hypothetical protein
MSPLAEREMAPSITQPTWTDFIVGAFLFAGLTFTVGYEFAVWRAEQKPARIEYRQAPAPLTQWACTKQEFREYQFACKQRALSSLTGKT